MRADSVRVGVFFFFQAEDGIRDKLVTGVQTCALPISRSTRAYRLYNDGELPVVDWEFHDLTLTFRSGSLFMARITGRSVPTRRGLRIGDPAERVVELYAWPRQSHSDATRWLFARSTAPSNWQGMVVRLGGGVVKEIIVGTVIYGD